MSNLPLLLPIQKALLIDLVEAAERVPPEQRAHFLVIRFKGIDANVTVLSHPGLPDNNPGVFFGDLEVFAHLGLILLRAESEKTHEITLLPDAYLHYGFIKQPTLPAARAAVREVVEATLVRASRALRVMERASAIYGSASMPAHMAIELEDKRVEVADLKKRLSDLDAE